MSTETYQFENLTICVTSDKSVTAVAWSGMSDSRDPVALLTPTLHKLVERLTGTSVNVDFRGLIYMNSATVGVILNFVKKLNAKSIPTKLFYDMSTSWQRVQCQCMKVVVRALASVEIAE